MLFPSCVNAETSIARDTAIRPTSVSTSGFGRLYKKCLAFTLLLVVVGCGPGVVKINGKLLKNGSPMVVPETTYVTLSFIQDTGRPGNFDARTVSAKFDPKSGTYTAEMPPGRYHTMVVVALPAKKAGQLNAPSKPAKSEKAHELTKDQVLDIDVSGN